MKEPKYLDEAFQKVCEEMLSIFIKKHRDYGKGNILELEELGICYRIGEKLSRLKHILTKKITPANESIEETWIDIAVYAVIAVLYLRGWFKKLEMRSEKIK